MGKTEVSFKVYGADGQVEELEAVADIGATFSKIPESVAIRLGLELKYETEVELGDGRLSKRKLALADIEMEGVRRPVLVSLGEKERPLIGYTALETLGFKVNPITRKLEKTIPIEYGEKRLPKSPFTKGGLRGDCHPPRQNSLPDSGVGQEYGRSNNARDQGS